MALFKTRVMTGFSDDGVWTVGHEKLEISQGADGRDGVGVEDMPTLGPTDLPLEPQNPLPCLFLPSLLNASSSDGSLG